MATVASLTALPASADPGVPGAGAPSGSQDHRSSLTPFAPPSADLVRSSTSSGGVSTQATFPSPSQCRGQSNNPHKASSVDNSVKGFAYTQCVANVPYIEVKTSVWRSRWWGYEHVGTDGFNSTTWWYYQGAIGVYSPCQVNRWRTVGNHVAQDIDNAWYSIETMQYADVTC